MVKLICIPSNENATYKKLSLTVNVLLIISIAIDKVPIVTRLYLFHLGIH